jgi:uncharacterized protein (DUF305 family)
MAQNTTPNAAGIVAAQKAEIAEMTGLSEGSGHHH